MVSRLCIHIITAPASASALANHLLLLFCRSSLPSTVMTGLIQRPTQALAAFLAAVALLMVLAATPAQARTGGLMAPAMLDFDYSQVGRGLLQNSNGQVRSQILHSVKLQSRSVQKHVWSVQLSSSLRPSASWGPFAQWQLR